MMHDSADEIHNGRLFHAATKFQTPQVFVIFEIAAAMLVLWVLAPIFGFVGYLFVNPFIIDNALF